MDPNGHDKIVIQTDQRSKQQQETLDKAQPQAQRGQKVGFIPTFIHHYTTSNQQKGSKCFIYFYRVIIVKGK